MKLDKLVDIIIPTKVSCTQETCEEILVFGAKDYAKSGYTTECGIAKKVDTQKYLKYKLQEHDVLVSKNTPFRIAIIGELNQPLLSNEHNFILRLKNQDNIKENAIALYMYLKSIRCHNDLESKVSNNVSYQSIKKQDLLELNIPSFDNISQIVENFHTEQKLYNEIYEATIKIHKLRSAFDDKGKTQDLGVCKMCRVNKATHLRVDTWKPFQKGMPLCDRCSNNIMF